MQPRLRRESAAPLGDSEAATGARLHIGLHRNDLGTKLEDSESKSEGRIALGIRPKNGRHTDPTKEAFNAKQVEEQETRTTQLPRSERGAAVEVPLTHVI